MSIIVASFVLKEVLTKIERESQNTSLVIDLQAIYHLCDRYKDIDFLTQNLSEIVESPEIIVKLDSFLMIYKRNLSRNNAALLNLVVASIKMNLSSLQDRLSKYGKYFRGLDFSRGLFEQSVSTHGGEVVKRVYQSFALLYGGVGVCRDATLWWIKNTLACNLVSAQGVSSDYSDISDPAVKLMMRHHDQDIFDERTIVGAFLYMGKIKHSFFPAYKSQCKKMYPVGTKIDINPFTRNKKIINIVAEIRRCLRRGLDEYKEKGLPICFRIRILLRQNGAFSLFNPNKPAHDLGFSINHDGSFEFFDVDGAWVRFKRGQGENFCRFLEDYFSKNYISRGNYNSFTVNRYDTPAPELDIS